MFGPRGEKVEYRVHRRCNFRVAGEQAQIGIEVRRRRIVVACSQVSVLPYLSARLLPGQQGQFAMSFLTHEPVEYLHARLLQRTGPANVGRFVKAGLELDHHCHFFGLGRFNEGAHDG